MGIVGGACLPSNAYYPRTPDYTLYIGVHVCWSEHSDSSFVYEFMSLDYGLGTMTATTIVYKIVFQYSKIIFNIVFIVRYDRNHENRTKNAKREKMLHFIKKKKKKKKKTKKKKQIQSLVDKMFYNFPKFRFVATKNLLIKKIPNYCKKFLLHVFF